MLGDHIIKNVPKPDDCVIVATFINSWLGIVTIYNITILVQYLLRSSGCRPWFHD